MLAKKIGIDLGSSSLLVHVRGEGIVLREPSLVALSPLSGRVLAVGRAAAALAAGRDGAVRGVRPVRGGTLADPAAVAALLHHLVVRFQGRQRLFRPEIMLAVPAGLDSRRRREVTRAAVEAGARQAWLIDEPLAAALGAGLPVAELRAHAVCDIGGGGARIGVTSLSGLVAAHAVPVGGEWFDRAIAARLESLHGLRLDGAQAESLKLTLGCALPERPRSERVIGVDASSGRPRAATVGSDEVGDALGEPLAALAAGLREALAELPPGTAGDVAERGLVLTGGAAQLPGLAAYLGGRLGLRTRLAEDPQACVVRGAALALERLDAVGSSQFYLR